MAEYSRFAQGSFVSTAGQKQVIYLPFVPEYVRVLNMTGMNSTSAGSGEVANAEWNASMNQGDGIAWVKQSTTSAIPLSINTTSAGNGISTFSAGLSFSFGPQQQIASITKGNPALVTSVANHGLVTGDVVIFEGITGMSQITNMPFSVNVLSATTFNINWNTNQSNYTAISGSPAPAVFQKIKNPFLYAPGVSFISSIALGATTVIGTTAAANLVVGQEVAFRVPSIWGTTQLNSLPNNVIPGSPIYGYVTAISSYLNIPGNVVTVAINSTAYTAFNSNPVYKAGMTSAQLVAVGDVNTGGYPYSGGNLYPSPVVNGVSTINGPAIQGAFVNNTRMGFVVGSAVLTSGDVGSSYFWQASAPDYSNYQVIGVTTS